MNSISRCFLLFAFFFSFSACQQNICFNKNQFVSSYEDFFNDFENKSKDRLTASEKESFEKRYEDLIENCYKKYKSEFSSEEKADFWKSSVKFYLKKEGGILNLNFDDKEDPIRDYIAEEIEELADSTTQDLEAVIEGLLESELPKLIDNIVDKVTEIGEEIKISIEENE